MTGSDCNKQLGSSDRIIIAYLPSISTGSFPDPVDAGSGKGQTSHILDTNCLNFYLQVGFTEPYLTTSIRKAAWGKKLPLWLTRWTPRRLSSQKLYCETLQACLHCHNNHFLLLYNKKLAANTCTYCSFSIITFSLKSIDSYFTSIHCANNLGNKAYSENCIVSSCELGLSLLLYTY